MVHKRLVEDALTGLDINQYAIQFAACNLTLGAPTVDYRQMRLETMPHGPHDGDVRTGSIEILASTNDRSAMNSLGTNHRTLHALHAEQVDGETGGRAALHDYDMVLMNPPFSSADKAGQKYGSDVRTQLQARLKHIEEELVSRDAMLGASIDVQTVGSYFTPIADALCRSEMATLAKVVPVTALINVTGEGERKALAARFDVEVVVASHDPKRPNFSESSAIHEALFIARRGRSLVEPKLVRLRKMPGTAEEAEAVVAWIRSDAPTSEWGRQGKADGNLIKQGDYRATQWYDERLAAIPRSLNGQPDWAELGQLVELGPSGQTARDSWVRCEPSQAEEYIFDSGSAKVRTSLEGAPDTPVKPGARRAHLWKNTLAGAGHVLLANRLNTQSGCCTAVACETRHLGFAWTPVKNVSYETAKRIAVIWNSTPIHLQLLDQRAKMLTYPRWEPTYLRRVRVPKFNGRNGEILEDVFDQLADATLPRLRDGADSEIRRQIDEAVATVGGLNEDEVAEWRELLSREPTISNQQATVDGG